LIVAGKRKLTLPDSFPYGVRGVGDLAHSRATLVCELGLPGAEWIGTLTICPLGALYKTIPGTKRKVYWSQQ